MGIANIAEHTLLIVPMQSLLSSIDRYRPPNPTPSAAQSQLNDGPVYQPMVAQGVQSERFCLAATRELKCAYADCLVLCR